MATPHPGRRRRRARRHRLHPRRRPARGRLSTADFASAVRLLDAVAVVADELDHHPDVRVGWGSIAFELSSHDAGGVTARDLRLAQRIQALADKQGATPAEE